MKLLVVAVGERMPAWISAGFDEYAKRMPRESRIELVQIKPARRSPGTGPETALKAERDRILAALPRSCTRMVLDERGESVTTAGLAQWLSSLLASGRDAAFIIGGADGLHPEVKARADRCLSLSPLTLPHGLVRVLLAEQLYRAASLLQGHPYHRA